MTCSLKSADTIEEAVSQFYENPNKYSHSPALGISTPVNDAKKPGMQVDAPPSYAPVAQTMSRAQHSPHTNAIIEAGHVRARDEVRFKFAALCGGMLISIKH